MTTASADIEIVASQWESQRSSEATVYHYSSWCALQCNYSYGDIEKGKCLSVSPAFNLSAEDDMSQEQLGPLCRVTLESDSPCVDQFNLVTLASIPVEEWLDIEFARDGAWHPISELFGDDD